MNDRIKNETRVLWDKCFSEEDKRFVDFYFEKRYNENDNIFIEKDEKGARGIPLGTPILRGRVMNGMLCFAARGH